LTEIAISINFATYFYSVTFNQIHTCYSDSETKYFKAALVLAR